MAGTAKKRAGWDPFKMYDVSPEEMRAIKERAAMKNELKAEFRKKISNPYRGGGYLVSAVISTCHYPLGPNANLNLNGKKNHLLV